MTGSSHQQIPARLSEAKPFGCVLKIHTVNVGRILESYDIGAALVLLEKIASVTIDERKVGGYYDSVCRNRTMIGYGAVSDKAANPTVLVYSQSF